jgi:hypothetical protein
VVLFQFKSGRLRSNEKPLVDALKQKESNSSCGGIAEMQYPVAIEIMIGYQTEQVF